MHCKRVCRAQNLCNFRDSYWLTSYIASLESCCPLAALSSGGYYIHYCSMFVHRDPATRLVYRASPIIMKPVGATKVSAAKTTATEDKVRKSLHNLQPAATDKENLVGAGRMVRSSTLPAKDILKTEVTEKNNKNDVTKRKKKDKAVQTARGEKIKINVEDLTSEAGPSENYWEVLAERRRIALEDALEENKELTERVAKLEDENRICKEMLDETRTLVEVLQEMIGEDRNDINNSLEDSTL